MVREQPRVVIGQLVNPQEIRTEHGATVEVKDWQDRAKWSFLRLVNGRKVDDEITSIASHFKKQARIAQLLEEARQERPLQFIMSSSNILAVASLKHLILDPQQVFNVAAEILKDAQREQIPLERQRLAGQVFYIGGFAGIKTGVQVDGGDILTRTAVRVAVFARVEMCFNPLSFLGISGLGRFGILGDFERVLRIEKISELKPRLETAITNARGHLDDLETRVFLTQGNKLTNKAATTINGALCMAYGLGEKTIRQVMTRYKEEDKTQYGLAMAQSWAAEHGEHRAKGFRVPQSLSTISGATLLLESIAKAQTKCKQWLQGQKSELAAQLLRGKLP